VDSRPAPAMTTRGCRARVEALIPRRALTLHHPGGGISPDQTRWIACPPGFFLSVRALSHCFRDRFLLWLQTAFANGELRFSGSLDTLAAPADFTARIDASTQIECRVGGDVATPSLTESSRRFASGFQLRSARA
jgi:hypothetical protein